MARDPDVCRHSAVTMKDDDDEVDGYDDVMNLQNPQLATSLPMRLVRPLLGIPPPRHLQRIPTDPDWHPLRPLPRIQASRLQHGTSLSVSGTLRTKH